MRETRLKGNYQGGGVPYGYTIEGRKIVIDEPKAEVVRYMYEQFSKGVYVRQIVAELTARGILYHGRPFAKTPSIISSKTINIREFMTVTEKPSPICTRPLFPPRFSREYGASSTPTNTENEAWKSSTFYGENSNAVIAGKVSSRNAELPKTAKKDTTTNAEDGKRG